MTWAPTLRARDRTNPLAEITSRRMFGLVSARILRRAHFPDWLLDRLFVDSRKCSRCERLRPTKIHRRLERFLTDSHLSLGRDERSNVKNVSISPELRWHFHWLPNRYFLQWFSFWKHLWLQFTRLFTVQWGKRLNPERSPFYEFAVFNLMSYLR